MITVEVNDTAIRAALQRLTTAVSDLEPVFRDIGEQLTKSTKDRFAAGEAPDGTPWAENKPVTLARKSSNKPLIGESKRLGNEIAFALTGDGVEIGSGMEYAAMQQFGGSTSEFPHLWGDIPARPFLGISDDDEQKILAIITEAIDTAIH